MEKILSNDDATSGMEVKHHCIICGSLIYSGMYCADCLDEISRARSIDEESLDEWLSRNRFLEKKTVSHSLEGVKSLLDFC